MKAVSPIALFCLSCVLFTCSEPERTGNQIDYIRYYIDSDLTDPEFFGRREFSYDAEGRIKQITWKPASGKAEVSQYTYEENLTTIKADSAEYFLKFERGRLAQYISKETFRNGAQRSDTIFFSYVSGKLKTITYDNEEYDIQVDIRANISYILEDGIYKLQQYDKVPNPFQNLPTRFLSFTRGEAQKKNIVWLNVIRYFSSNNSLDQIIREYSYREGKVSEIVSYGNLSSVLIIPMPITTERIRYKPL